MLNKQSDLETQVAIEAIEIAERATPFCPCGEATAPEGRDGNVWLECISLREEPKGGTIIRLLRSVMAPVHVHELIIDSDRAA
jgi:hypothetical protein